MAWFSSLRSLVYLRRLVVATERHNDLVEARLKAEYPNLFVSGQLDFKRKPGRFKSFDLLDVTELNKQYQEKQPDEEDVWSDE